MGSTELHLLGLYLVLLRCTRLNQAVLDCIGLSLAEVDSTGLY